MYDFSNSNVDCINDLYYVTTVGVVSNSNTG